MSKNCPGRTQNSLAVLFTHSRPTCVRCCSQAVGGGRDAGAPPGDVHRPGLPDGVPHRAGRPAELPVRGLLPLQQHPLPQLPSLLLRHPDGTNRSRESRMSLFHLEKERDTNNYGCYRTPDMN